MVWGFEKVYRSAGNWIANMASAPAVLSRFLKEQPGA
jgi:hypothetical protein